MYDLYSINDVFARKNINVVCNQIMTDLTNQDFADFNNHFALSGDAAFHYENATTGPIKQIQFVTDEREIYLHISRNLKRICPGLSELFTYEEKIIAKIDDVYFEFFLKSKIDTKEFNRIYIEA